MDKVALRCYMPVLAEVERDGVKFICHKNLNPDDKKKLPFTISEYTTGLRVFDSDTDDEFLIDAKLDDWLRDFATIDQVKEAVKKLTVLNE